MKPTYKCPSCGTKLKFKPVEKPTGTKRLCRKCGKLWNAESEEK